MLPGLSNLLGALLFAASAHGCVLTAECDASIACDDGFVCYDYVCRRACTSDDDCSGVDVCRSCTQDDADGAANHCFDLPLAACLAEEP